MDIIFAFAQPFIEFFSKHYVNGCFIFIFVLITGIAISAHLSKNARGEHTMTADDVCASDMGGSVLIIIWPIIITLAIIAGICYLYYFLVGILIRLIIRRIK